MAITITPVTAANSNFGPLGSAAWAAGMQFGGLTAGRIPYPSSATALTDSANFMWEADVTAGKGLTLASGTATTQVSNILASQTWNAAGVTFTGWKFTITDTASAAGSLAMQILGGASGTTSLFSLSKGGIGSFEGSVATNGNILAGFPTAANNLKISVFSDTGSQGITLGISSDVNFNRISAGLAAIGTGAAGSFAGRLKLTSAIAAGVAISALNAAPTTGEIQSVTDALAPVIGNAVAAGGAAKALVWYNGAQWTVVSI